MVVQAPGRRTKENSTKTSYYQGRRGIQDKKILNKRIVREKKKFLVQWKRYMAEGDTWKSRKNLKNTKELVEEFEREYREEAEEVR